MVRNVKYYRTTSLQFSGTFGFHTGLALNLKMPKEPSSPSHSNAWAEK